MSSTDQEKRNMNEISWMWIPYIPNLLLFMFQSINTRFYYQNLLSACYLFIHSRSSQSTLSLRTLHQPCTSSSRAAILFLSSSEVPNDGQSMESLLYWPLDSTVITKQKNKNRWLRFEFQINYYIQQSNKSYSEWLLFLIQVQVFECTNHMLHGWLNSTLSILPELVALQDMDLVRH